jgi:hypothetical protein
MFHPTESLEQYSSMSKIFRYAGQGWVVARKSCLPKTPVALDLRRTWSCQVLPKRRAPHPSRRTWFSRFVGLAMRSAELADPQFYWSVIDQPAIGYDFSTSKLVKWEQHWQNSREAYVDTTEHGVDFLLHLCFLWPHNKIPKKVRNLFLRFLFIIIIFCMF